MLKHTLATLGLILTAGTLASCKAEGDKPAPTSASAASQGSMPLGAKPLTVEESASVSVTAKVSAVNLATRQITLVDSSGRTRTLIAGPEIQRLNEVRVGDEVTVEFMVALVAELRPPTADETTVPVAMVEYEARAPKSEDPSAGKVRAVRVVTTVEAVDLARMSVTLKGPGGETASVRARSEENIKKLHVGDTIVITYVEAVAVSLTKAPKG